jgi:ankyrin repeat protein
MSSALLLAMLHRDQAAFVRELDRLPSIDATDAEGMTVLLTAASCGDVDDLKCVLARGPDLNRAQWSRGTPLMAAVSRGDADAARLLLHAGADPRRLSARGDSPLLAAMCGGSEECVEMVVAAVERRGGDLFPPGVRENPLNIAACDDAGAPVIRRLLAAGVDPNRAGANGQLPLVTALLSGSPRAAALLLSAGADSDLPDGRGRTARGLAGGDRRLDAEYSPAP